MKIYHHRLYSPPPYTSLACHCMTHDRVCTVHFHAKLCMQLKYSVHKSKTKTLMLYFQRYQSIPVTLWTYSHTVPCKSTRIVMDWSPQSLDHKITEAVWHHPDRLCYKRQPTSKEEFWNDLLEAWGTVADEYEYEEMTRALAFRWSGLTAYQSRSVLYCICMNICTLK